MVIEPIMPLVLMQDMGPTAKLAHDAVVRPEMAQAMSRLITNEKLHEQSQQVQKPEEGDQMNSVNDEGGGNAQHNLGQGTRKRKPPPDEPDPPPRPTGDPFVGKLVNKKI